MCLVVAITSFGKKGKIKFNLEDTEYSNENKGCGFIFYTILDLPLTPIIEGFVILKKNPDYDED